MPPASESFDRRNFLKITIPVAASWALGCSPDSKPTISTAPSAEGDEILDTYRGLYKSIRAHAETAAEAQKPLYIFIGEDHTDRRCAVAEMMVLDICRRLVNELPHEKKYQNIRKGLRNLLVEDTEADVRAGIRMYRSDRVISGRSNIDFLIPVGEVTFGMNVKGIEKFAPPEAIQKAYQKAKEGDVVAQQAVTKWMNDTVKEREDFMKDQSIKAGGGTIVSGALHAKTLVEVLRSEGAIVLPINTVERFVAGPRTSMEVYAHDAAKMKQVHLKRFNPRADFQEVLKIVQSANTAIAGEQSLQRGRN